MTSSTSPSAELLPPRPGPPAQLAFWARVLWETLASRDLGRLLRRRLGGEPLEASGLGAVPAAGPLVLAVNHLSGGLTPGVIAAAVLAAARARPGLEDECLLVVGHRPLRPGAPRLARGLRRLAEAFYRRWAGRALRIPLGNARARPTGLRAFRERARARPVLVFPEGRVGLELGPVRPGAGRWLGGLGVPVVPVAVWGDGRGWRVSFGAPVRWSRRRELHDLQLGLALASLLPPRLAPAWQPTLARWRQAHAAAASAPAPIPSSGVAKVEQAL